MIHPIKKESNILLVNSLPKAQQDIKIPIKPTCAIRVHIPQVIKESYNYVANYYLEIIDNIIERVKRNLDDDFGIKPGNLMSLTWYRNQVCSPYDLGMSFIVDLKLSWQEIMEIE